MRDAFSHTNSRDRVSINHRRAKRIASRVPMNNRRKINLRKVVQDAGGIDDKNFPPDLGIRAQGGGGRGTTYRCSLVEDRWPSTGQSRSRQFVFPGIMAYLAESLALRL